MSFLLSCISTQHSMLKHHWQQSQEHTNCPLTVLGSYRKPDSQGGLLCLVGEHGKMQAHVELEMPSGMVRSERGVLVASHNTIHEVSLDMSSVHYDVISLPSFNLLHSLSRTKRGYLGASTGLDAIVEFSHDGQLLWSWWATEHGFEYTPALERRVLDTSADHRIVKYGTLAQTTHVNAAVEYSDGSILATLFHQGMIIRIDRASGDWQPVLQGLDHPHAVRVVAEDYITVADTGHGRALLVKLHNGQGSIEAEIQADTTWLQDCYFDYRNDQWLLVDGKNTRILIAAANASGKAHAQLDLDPEWRLYEVLPL